MENRLKALSLLISLLLVVSLLPGTARAAGDDIIHVKFVYGYRVNSAGNREKDTTDDYGKGLKKAFEGTIKTYYGKPIQVDVYHPTVSGSATISSSDYSVLNSVTVENTQLLIIMHPDASLDDYALTLKAYMQNGGCLWLCGENDDNFNLNNNYLNDLSKKLGISYTLGSQNVYISDAELHSSTSLGKANFYGSHTKVGLKDANNIVYSASNFFKIITYKGDTYMIDAPVAQGYLTVSADINLIYVYPNPTPWAAQILYNMLDRSVVAIENQTSSAHSHTWMYTPTDSPNAEISGHCTKISTPACEYYGQDKAALMTLGAVDVEYKANTPYNILNLSLTGPLVYAARAEITDAEYYSVNEDGTQGDKLDAPPINAGNYIVKATITTKDNATLFAKTSFVIKKAKPTISAPGYPHSTPKYDGTEKTLIRAGSTSGGTMQYSLDKEKWSEDLPKGTAAGEYNVYYKVDGGDNYTSSGVFLMNPKPKIEKVSPKVTAPKGLTQEYTGSPVSLVEAGTAEGGTMQYRVDNTTTWNALIPTRTAVGTYKVYWKVVGDSNHNDYGGSASTYVTAQITASTKPEPTYTEPSGLEQPYTGSPLPLINPGSVTGGTMRYSLDNTDWSTDVPKATEVGTYTVYWMIQGDEGYTSIASQSVTAKITSTQSGEQPTASADGYSGVYDGNPHSITVHLPDKWKDAKVTYSVDGVNYTEENPAYTEKGTYTVYYKVTVDGEDDFTGSAVVEIKSPVTPVTPDTPGIPSTPSTPNNPSTPGAPVSSGGFNTPGNTGTTSGSSRHRPSPGRSVLSVYPVFIPVEAPDGGRIRTSHTAAESGTVVTITATPSDGCKLDTLTVVDKNGEELTVTGKGRGRYTFRMPTSRVTVTAAFSQWSTTYIGCPKDETCPIWPYTDSVTTEWYHDGVHYCLENGLMIGYTGSTFKPYADTSRAMLTAMLWRLNGCPVVNSPLPFTDVAEDAWYSEAVRWAASEGIATGYRDGRFGPDDTLTREQMVTILWRYAQHEKLNPTAENSESVFFYADADQVGSYALPAMQWACSSGIVTGKGNADGTQMLLDPAGKGSRAQIATIAMRFIEGILH